MDKWLKKPVAKKRKHGEFSYFSYINYMTIYSHKFLTDCKLSELRIALINTITNHYIFVILRKVALFQHDYSKFSEERFLDDFKKLSWEDLYDENLNINYKFDKFFGRVNYTVHDHVPLK